MKSLYKTLAFCALIGASESTHAVTVGVDSSQTWNGYMNWFELPSNGGAFVTGQGWGVPDLKAAFSGGSLTLKACSINDPAGYWYVSPPGGPGSAGNKSMEALMYVEKTGPLSGQSVTFSGTVQANTWVSGYSTYAFIKDFAPDYSSVIESVSPTPLPAGSFSVTLNTIADPARHVQYGFKTIGANVWSTDVDSKGFIQIEDVPPPFVPDTIINGDFETAGGAGWGTTQGTPAFPTTGGNPNGNAELDGTAGFAVLYAFNNSEKTFASLGLAPGDTYTVQMDMKILSGTNIGFLRLEGPAGYVIDGPAPAIIGDGMEWATYSIELTVPASPAQAKFGLRPGDGSLVAFDNVKIVLPAPAGPLQASIKIGAAVSWTAASAVNRYQPQESPDGSTWSNLGPAIIGNAPSLVFDDSKSPFYQVLESAPFIQEAAFNGNFTQQGFFPDLAEGWTPVQSQMPIRVISGGRGDNGPHMKLQVINSGEEANGSEIQQNTRNIEGHVNGVVTPGNIYTFSFWAKQISIGVSYVQQYKVSWLDDGGVIKGDGGVQGFSAPVLGDWTKITQSGLVAPAGATSALIQILGVTGAVEGGSGEVLIDDVSLLSTGFGAPIVPALTATAVPTVEISWPSKIGQEYQVQSSPSLSGWENFGGVISGDGSIKAVYDGMTAPRMFYRVGELP